jgi:hypothetical protein
MRKSAVRFLHIAIGVAAVVAVLALLVAGSGMVLPSAVVYADTTCSDTSGLPCTLGPNLEVTSFSKGSGLGCGGSGATITADTSATDPGFTITGNTPCTNTNNGASSEVITSTLTISLTALNGFSIGDISASFTCGAAGGALVAVDFFGNFGGSCPSEAAGATGTLDLGELTITPTSTLSDVITITETIFPGQSATISSGTLNYSLLAPTVAPEPGSLSLLLLGLVGLPFARRRFAR